MKIVVTGWVEIALAHEDDWSDEQTTELRGLWTDELRQAVLSVLNEMAHADTRVAIYDVKAEVIAKP